MYNDTLNGSTEKRSSELPDAVGPIVQLQEKLYVPVKEYPDFVLSQTRSTASPTTRSVVNKSFKQSLSDPACLRRLALGNRSSSELIDPN
ncbi:Protein quaking [Anabarilius grahami]|uniref:Protein quaking n=1 Tax=Anabarilius grahami TaxID=495550 RepID=A0A3N0XTH7_ANAGA|nr:Protein quaking [Anabarilius grahami]